MSAPGEATLKQKKLLREALAGYAAANEVIREEKREWMQRMSPAESWQAFEALVAFGRELQGDPTTLHVFEKRRTEELIHMRKILERVARGQGYL